MQVVSISSMARVLYSGTEEGERLKRSLTLSSKYTQEIVPLYRETIHPNILDIPIGLIPRHVDEIKWQKAEINFTGTLKPEQQELEDIYLDHIKTKSGGIIQSPTGSGKTVFSISIMAKLGYKTLVIVPTDYLMRQWQTRLKTFTGLTDNDIGICRGDICQYKDKKVVIGMIHSLAKIGRYPQEFYNEFGLCIIDEVHTLSAPTFSKSIPQFHTKFRLGISATARRKDGLEKVFLLHIGNICAKSQTQEIKPVVYIMKYDDVSTHHGGCVYGGDLKLGCYFNRIASVGRRNEFIAKVTRQVYDKGRDILVLSDRINQLNSLKHGLMKDQKLKETDIGIFTGKRKIGLDRRILLATYGSAGLGADIPRLSAVLFATPRADIEQAVGRVLRTRQDKPQLVLDIVDTRSSIMVKWASKRRKYYQTIASRLIVA